MIIPLIPVYFTKSLENTFPETRIQISYSFSDLIQAIFMSWWLPEETDPGQWSLLMKMAFQFGLDSKLSTGSERFVCFLHSRDITRVLLPPPTWSRHFKSYCKSQNNLKYLLTFHYFYSLKYQAASSFWSFHDTWNGGLVTGTYIRTWALTRNPKSSWYHFQVKSLIVNMKKRNTPSSSEFSWDLLKDSP